MKVLFRNLNLLVIFSVISKVEIVELISNLEHLNNAFDTSAD